mgnify:CR=1 FL=1
MRSKKLLILYAFLLIVAVVTMVQLWRLNQRPQEIGPRDYPEIKEEGILRMITEYNQSGYFVSGDTVQGFQYELSQAIAKLSGLEVQTHLEMSLAKSFEELSDNKCDVIARNIPITSEMRENYLFTEPIVLNKQVLVQRTAEANNGQAPIRNQLDLAQKTLYIPKVYYAGPAKTPKGMASGSFGPTTAGRMDPYVDLFQSLGGSMIMVAKGDIDYAVCDQQIARMTQKKLPEVDILTDVSFTQLQSWAVRKDSPVLLDSLNSWLQQIKDSGLYDQIYKRYYK